MTTRKHYLKEFKLDAISLVLEQGYSRSEAARSLEINANKLGRWIKEHEAPEGQAFRGNGKLTAEQAEIRRLREENRRLKIPVRQQSIPVPAGVQWLHWQHEPQRRLLGQCGR